MNRSRDLPVTHCGVLPAVPARCHQLHRALWSGLVPPWSGLVEWTGAAVDWTGAAFRCGVSGLMILAACVGVVSIEDGRYEIRQSYSFSFTFQPLADTC